MNKNYSGAHSLSSSLKARLQVTFKSTFLNIQSLGSGKRMCELKIVSNMCYRDVSETSMMGVDIGSGTSVRWNIYGLGQRYR
jgi:hypothetical protein